jgi:hypothetical protein
MRRITGYIILLLLLGSNDTLHAQTKKRAKKPTKAHTQKRVTTPKKEVGKPVTKDDEDLKSATIEIVQSYRPEVRVGAKKEPVPSLPAVDTVTADVNYNVPSQSLSYGYFALPLRPLSLTKDSAKRAFSNYVKLGGGNLSTIYLDAGIAALHGKNYETAIHLHHLSQAGKITGQKSSLTGVEADGSYRTNKHTWNGGVSIFRNVYNSYGFNDVLASPYILAMQQLNGAGLYVEMHSNNTDAKWVYQPSIKTSFLNTSDGNEYTASIALPFSYAVNENLHFITGLSGSYVNLSYAYPTSANNNMAQLQLGVEYSKGPIRFKAVMQPTVGRAGNWYLLPDVTVHYNIPKTQFAVLAGWQGSLQQNTLSQMTATNPFLRYNTTVYNTATLQQTHADEVFGGVQTNLGNHIAVSGKVSWKQYDNMPLMINDTASNKKYFMVTYDKVNALTFSGAVRYQVNNMVSVGLNLAYISYNTTVNRRAWHEPGLKLNADLTVKPLPQLLFTAYMSVMDEVYAIDNGNTTVKLKGMMDAGLGTEYEFMPRLSGFLQVHNLLNNSYQRWYGYSAYGFNIFGGVRLKF